MERTTDTAAKVFWLVTGRGPTSDGGDRDPGGCPWARDHYARVTLGRVVVDYMANGVTVSTNIDGSDTPETIADRLREELEMPPLKPFGDVELAAAVFELVFVGKPTSSGTVGSFAYAQRDNQQIAMFSDCVATAPTFTVKTHRLPTDTAAAIAERLRAQMQPVEAPKPTTIELDVPTFGVADVLAITEGKHRLSLVRCAQCVSDGDTDEAREYAAAAQALGGLIDLIRERMS